jgi:hypothetical protein
MCLPGPSSQVTRPPAKFESWPLWAVGFLCNQFYLVNKHLNVGTGNAANLRTPLVACSAKFVSSLCHELFSFVSMDCNLLKNTPKLPVPGSRAIGIAGMMHAGKIERFV